MIVTSTILVQSEYPFDEVAFLNNGTLFASIGKGTIELRSSNIQESVRYLRSSGVDRDHYARSLAFNGSRLACAYSNGSICIWTWNEGVGFQGCGSFLQTGLGYISSIAFNYSGSLLAIGSFNGVVALLNTEPLSLRHKYSIDRRTNVISVAFNREGTLLASASTDATIRLHLIQNLNMRVFEMRAEWMVDMESIAFNHDGSKLAIAGSSGVILQPVRLDLIEHARLHLVNNHPENFQSTNPAICVAFSDDGSLMASGHDDGTINVWNLETGFTLRLTEHTWGVTTISFGPDRSFKSASRDRTIRQFCLYDAKIKTTIRELLLDGLFPSEWPQDVPSFAGFYKKYWRLEESKRVAIDAKIKAQGAEDPKEFIMWLSEQMAEEDGLLCPVCNMPMSIDKKCGANQVCMACPTSSKHLLCVHCRDRLQQPQRCPICKTPLGRSRIPKLQDFANQIKEAKSEGVGGGVVECGYGSPSRKRSKMK